MDELKNIIEKVKEALSEKEKEIEAAGSVGTYTHGAFENRKLEVALFENSAKHVTNDPFLKSTILENYEKDAAKLIIEINSIEV